VSLWHRLLLAWRVLQKERTRLLVAILGIAFADVLMLMQLAIRDALFISTSTVQESIKGDLFVLNKNFETLIAPLPIERATLYRCLGHHQVESVAALYLSIIPWKNPVTRTDRGILVMGYDPYTNLFDEKIATRQEVDKLKRFGDVLFDRQSRPEFGPIPDLLKRDGSVITEVNRVQVRVVGLATIGAGFGADGNIICSDTTFHRIFPYHKPRDIEVGVIRLKPGADPVAVARDLNAITGNTGLVTTKEQFVERERAYWRTATPIGYIFNLGVVLGFVVGVIIVYQILHSDVNDHLAEYATMKAMGYGTATLSSILLLESILLAVMGYVPGYFIATGFYSAAHAATQLPIYMTVERAQSILIATVAMCSFSALIASRRLNAADPADIF
jgi:putative ABC transport system permease protein